MEKRNIIYAFPENYRKAHSGGIMCLSICQNASCVPKMRRFYSRRHRHKWKDNIKTDSMEIRSEGADGNHRKSDRLFFLKSFLLFHR
jgi:hypothetical protein